MAWIRVIWKEDSGKEFEEVVPNTWADCGVLRWPKRNGAGYIKERRTPAKGWFHFPVLKIKYRSDSFQECQQYDDASSDKEEQLTPVNKTLKRSNQTSDFDHVLDSEESASPKKPKMMTKYKRIIVESDSDDPDFKPQDTSFMPEPASPKKPKTVTKCKRLWIDSDSDDSDFHPQDIESDSDDSDSFMSESASTKSKSEHKMAIIESDSDDTDDTDLDFNYISFIQALSADKTKILLPSRPSLRRSSTSSSAGEPIWSRQTSSCSEADITPQNSQKSPCSHVKKTTPTTSRRLSNDQLNIPLSMIPQKEASSPDKKVSESTTVVGSAYPMENACFQNKVITLLLEIKDMIAKNQPAESEMGDDRQEIVKCYTLQDFEDQEEELDKDKQYRLALFQKLKCIGGSSYKKNIKNLLNRSMSIQLMSLFNISAGGPNSKPAFKKTRLYKVMRDAVLANHIDTTETQVATAMGECLKHALKMAACQERMDRLQDRLGEEEEEEDEKEEDLEP